jgi:streptomycin 6-kinase
MSEMHVRLQERVLAWHVTVDQLFDTASSVVAFGGRDQQPVVLKVVKHPGDEWSSGQVLEAFAGRGVVRILEHAEGAVLLERLVPGRSLADGDLGDDEVTSILADVIGRMSPGPPPTAAPTIESWGQGFEPYLARGTPAIPKSLVEAAHKTYLQLCASQATPRLLHGDLHHHNVLLDSHRGWLAIDPKGVVDEPAYEIGAALRNPCRQPELFAAPRTILKRVDCFARVLRLDTERILAWAFAQAVLAAIWELEDDGALNVGKGWIALANTIRPMLTAH